MSSDARKALPVDAGEEMITLRVKLFASLHVYLPEGSMRNAVDLQVPATITPNELLDRLHVPRDLAHLVLCNGVYLKPEQREQPVFVPGDAFAVWPPVAGG
ncbi:MoaD/ThiS family protein [Aquisalimonas sp. 2447]|uniref:MoaD/ThiS family protein n=1 Tax=Aquisalimonas sp. 2447 TaxID=2740807 RepID=UPI00143259AF|nr:MoaD/ThiS family protein [Aquisalimonas sp. 2447]QIT55656.1 MoaD/ThiS family protein [Aquisalimonas sp. 2447]